MDGRKHCGNSAGYEQKMCEEEEIMPTPKQFREAEERGKAVAKALRDRQKLMEQLLAAAHPTPAQRKMERQKMLNCVNQACGAMFSACGSLGRLKEAGLAADAKRIAEAIREMYERMTG